MAADEGGGSKFVAPPPPVPLRTAPGTHDTPPSDAESGAHAVSPGKSPLSSPAMGRSYYVGRRAIGLGPRTEDPQTAWELHGSADMRDRYIPNPDVEARMEFAPMESTLPSSDKPVGIVRGGIVTHAVVACRQGANQRVIRCTVKASPGLAMNVRNRVRADHVVLLAYTPFRVCAPAHSSVHSRVPPSRAECERPLEFGDGGRGQVVFGGRRH